METKTLSTLDANTISSLVLNGDLSKLNSQQKVQYYNALCERIGLDPATQPFKLLRLNNKEILYADKGATQQLCKVYNISLEVTKTEKIDDVYVVTVRAKTAERFADEIGAVTIANLKGDYLANSLMKASTKAKRRAVLALCGLGMLDESEIETIPKADPVDYSENFDKRNEDFYNQAKEEIPELNSNSDILKWKTANKDNINFLSEEMRTEILTDLNARQQEIITGNKPKSKLNEYCTKIHSFASRDDLQKWFKDTQKEILASLSKEECTTLAQEYRIKYNELSPKEIPQDILVVAKENNWTEREVKDHCNEIFGCDVADLKPSQMKIVANYIRENSK